MPLSPFSKLLVDPVQFFKQATLYPLAVLRESARSYLKYAQTAFQKTNVIIKKEYNHKPILLIALYEKYELRNDVKRLLCAAQKCGYFVVAVNTLRLSDPKKLFDVVDCYIEKPNFGRDFGSYQTGFMHIFNNGYEKTCSRVLMVNDSIYFSTKGLEEFLVSMRDAWEDALGATENFEIKHHLGSFCISFSSYAINHKKFRQYWKDYKNTDVRPLVIKRGEMKLSSVLKSIARNENYFSSIYSSANFLSRVIRDRKMISEYLKCSRKSDRVDWKKFGIQDITELFIDKSVSNVGKISNSNGAQTQNINLFMARNTQEKIQYDKLFLSYDIDSLECFINTNVVQTDKSLFESLVISFAVEVFRCGSQIHQNATILYEMGLPIVKLDLIFRGMFDEYDLLNILNKMNEIERIELKQLLLARPFGSSVLIGIDRAAFERGLI